MTDIVTKTTKYAAQWLKFVLKCMVVLAIFGIPLLLIMEYRPDIAQQLKPVMKWTLIGLYGFVFAVVVTGMSCGMYAAVKNRSVMQFLYSLVLGAAGVGYILYRVGRSFPEAWQTVSAWFL